MNLPNPFSNSGGEPPIYFLSALVSDGRIQSALGKIVAGNVELVESSSVHEFNGDEDCLLKADESLRDLGPDSESVNEVVFGFEESWVKKDGIISAKKPLLKKITEKLGLEPVGFVPIADALSQYLISDPMLSAVCLYSQADMVYVYLIKQGKVVKSQKVGRSGSIVDDLTEGLARLSQEAQEKKQYFPAKILLVSSALTSGEIAERQQDLLQHPWQEKYPFLQVPTVDVMPTHTLINAVTQQGGRAFAKVNNIPLKPVASDVAEEKKQDSQNASSFGVPVSNDVLSSSETVAYNSTHVRSDNMEGDEEWVVPNTALSSGKKDGFFAKHKKQLLAGFAIGLFTLMAMSFVFLTVASKAQVNLSLATVTVAKDVKITLDPTAEESDPDELILSASLVTEEISGSDNIETTGVKLVGEKATGKVTIFNKTQSQKRFAAGTKLTSDKINYTLDGDVEVASASVEEKHSGETKQYGKAEVSVTANEIGADANISANTNLIIDSFSDDTYYASVIDDFSGGSSREIQVVAQADVKELTASLTKSLEEEAKEFFEQNSTGGRYMEPIDEYKQIKKELSNEVGKEVANLSLDLTIEFSAIEYATDDIRPLATAVLGSEVPENYSLVDKDPEILSSPSEEASGEAVVVLDANISSQAKPNVDMEAIKQEIVGKNISEAQRILDNKKEIKKVVISLWPRLAEKVIGKMPNKSEQIQVSIDE